MTREEQTLLLKDLSTRLKHGVKIYDEKDNCAFELYGIEGNILISKTTYEERTYSKGIVSKHFKRFVYNVLTKKCCKPYLRPMSSMTEEEIVEYIRIHLHDNKAEVKKPEHCCGNSVLAFVAKQSIRYWYANISTIDVLDWLNEHHFDYRGLIEKGLAIEAPKGMYKI